jgi:hypothetical protein
MPLGTANARAGQGAARAMLVPQFCCTHVMQGVPPHACCAPAMNWRLHAAKRSRERAGRPRHSPSPLTSTTAMARGQEHAQCRGTGEVRRVDPCAWERKRRFTGVILAGEGQGVVVAAPAPLPCLGQKQHRNCYYIPPQRPRPHAVSFLSRWAGNVVVGY